MTSIETTSPNASLPLSLWSRYSNLLKLMLIGFLTLILLIPSAWIQSLIEERQNRKRDVIADVEDKWSSSQILQGPILILPLNKKWQEKDSTGKTISGKAYLLPSTLKIQSVIVPEILHRGIFKSVVYDSKSVVTGTFSPFDLKKAGIESEQVDWQSAKLVMGVGDFKGLKNSPTINVRGVDYPVEPYVGTDHPFVASFYTNLNPTEHPNTPFSFRYELDLRGSEALEYRQLAKNTDVEVEGKWPKPSFTGRFLPDTREISKDYFKASWSIPYFNRNLPQQWVTKSGNYSAETNALEQAKGSDRSETHDGIFGVKLLLSLGEHQQTMRSAKYAFIIILLTFVSLFFTELITRKKIGLLQFVLIGSAMVIYYSLLLSFSEQIGFAAAYVVASVATITLITGFVMALTRSKQIGFITAGVLGALYSFIYVLNQLEDFALLCGSIGLFVVIALLMFLSLKIDFNRPGAPSV